MGKYTYEQLVDDLTRGHEIEFLYNGKKYSFSHNIAEWYITKYEEEDDQVFVSPSDLLKRGRIEDKPIIDIWAQISEIMVY